jgi:hypothetical protein
LVEVAHCGLAAFIEQNFGVVEPAESSIITCAAVAASYYLQLGSCSWSDPIIELT